MHTTNYHDTFIAVSEDCPVSVAEIPPERKGGKTIARLQYEMIHDHPYVCTSDDVIFGVFATRNDIGESERAEERKQFFSEGQACMRTSALPKRYGWGIHSDEEGKIAIFGVETEEYRSLSSDERVEQLRALRS